MTALLTTAEACERYPNLSPRLIRSWRDRDRIQPAGRIGRETLWPADRLRALEAEKNRRVAGLDKRCRRNVAATAGASMPAQSVPRLAYLRPRMVTMAAGTDNAAHIEPLTEAAVTVLLPSGQRLRIDVAVMPDLSVHGIAEIVQARIPA